MDLPNLPVFPSNYLDINIIPANQFTRKKLKILIHLITGELKLKGTKIPHIFLPFRSKVSDDKLEKLLSRLFPNGELITYDETVLYGIIKSTDDFTLICCLKYLWARLPNNEVVGWDVYLEYKRREKDANYPKDAFFTIMPKCLSPAHASIFYDFMDLLMSVASNSQYNYLSGRKIAKMSSIWAFNSNKSSTSVFYDATKENNFMEGLEIWKSTSDALFHLLLSFLRASLPENDADALKLPKTLQSLIITNSYPPQLEDSIKSMITIPCVLIRSTKVSSNPYELLSKARHTLSFDRKNQFRSIENYTILKNLFQKDSTADIVNTLTEESKRVLTRLTAKPIDSSYDLQPGWSHNQPSTEADIPLYSQITITDVTLQDYYIWTWLSTLGSDQTSRMKKLFGRSIVVEAGLKGFQKWLIITEQTMSTSEYLEIFKEPTQRKSNTVSELSYDKYIERTSLAESNRTTLPPLPSKENKQQKGLLPDISFADDDFKLDVPRNSNFLLDDNDDGASPDYRSYLKGLNELDVDNISESLAKSSLSKPTVTSRSLNKRRPPPLRSLIDEMPPPNNSLLSANPDSATHSQSQSPTRREISRSPSPAKDSCSQDDRNAYKEPYEVYEAKFSEPEAEKEDLEPYENYNVPGEDKLKPMKRDTERNNNHPLAIENGSNDQNGDIEKRNDKINKQFSGKQQQQYVPMMPPIPGFPPFGYFPMPMPSMDPKNPMPFMPMMPPPGVGTGAFPVSAPGTPTKLKRRSQSPSKISNEEFPAPNIEQLSPERGANYHKNNDKSPERARVSRSNSPHKRRSKSPSRQNLVRVPNNDSETTVEYTIQQTMDQIRETMDSIPSPIDSKSFDYQRNLEANDNQESYSTAISQLNTQPNQSSPIVPLSQPRQAQNDPQVYLVRQQQQQQQNKLAAQSLQPLMPIAQNEQRHQSGSFTDQQKLVKANNSVARRKHIQENKNELPSLPVEESTDQRYSKESVNTNRSSLQQKSRASTPTRTSVPSQNSTNMPTMKPENINQPPKQNPIRPPHSKAPTHSKVPPPPPQQQQPPMGYPPYPQPYGAPMYPIGYPPQMPYGTSPAQSPQVHSQISGWPQMPPQGYYPPPNGYYPPPPNGQTGYYPPANYPPYPPQGYGPPHPQAYPPPVQHGATPNVGPPGAKASGGLSMVPKAGKFNKNATKNKANIRNALNEGFGI